MSSYLSPDTTGALLQATQNNASATASKLSQSKNIAAIEKTAREFEAVFVSAMLQPMFEGAKMHDSPFGGGKGEEIFGDMMLQEYGSIISKTGSLGIAKDVKAKLIELQGLQQPPVQNAAGNSVDMDKMAEELNDIIVGE